jgi:hypothetical protein
MIVEVNRRVRKRRLFRSHEQAELVGAIADTRAMFEEIGFGVSLTPNQTPSAMDAAATRGHGWT